MEFISTDVNSIKPRGRMLLEYLKSFEEYYAVIITNTRLVQDQTLFIVSVNYHT